MSSGRNEDFPAPEELPYVEDMAKNLAPYWRVYLIRGIFMTPFGLYFLFNPDQSLEVLANVFGAFLLIEGGIYLVQALVVCFRTESNSMLCTYIAGFLASVSIGIAIISYPHETANILLICAAVWFILIGIIQLLVAWIFRAAEVRGGSDLMIGGVGLLYVILGCIFFANLDGSVRYLIRILGVVVTLFGLQLLYLGFRLRYLTSIANEPTAMDDYAAASPTNEETTEETTEEAPLRLSSIV
jgi:uncharacterized membrane protein HdeD (DUF308 family)